MSVAHNLYCDDVSRDDDGEFFDLCFARASEFIPKLSRELFDNDRYQVIADCLVTYQNSIIPKFSVPDDVGKSDFLIPRNYFAVSHYTDDDRRKSLDISHQMSAGVFEAIGPSSSSFESGDN